MAILDVRDLCVSYETRQGKVRAIDGVTFAIEQGESLGLVGESGCGKTTAGKAFLRMLADNAAIVRGQMLYKGTDLVRLGDAEMRAIRGKEIAMIPQSAMNALDPVTRIDDLIREGMQSHREIAAEATRERVVELFGSVGLEAGRVADYPHMFSGGMRQRAVIAAVFALRPSLIIADEPTTALDVIVQDQVLKQLADLVRETGATLIAITHDIGIVAENCRTTGVMYAGKLVEIGPTDKVLITPCHPYTMGLQNGLLGVRDERREIISIPGVPPNLINPPPGCRFQPRCPFSPGALHRRGAAPGGHIARPPVRLPLLPRCGGDATGGKENVRLDQGMRIVTEPLLTIDSLKVWFPVATTLWGQFFKPQGYVKAVDGVSFTMNRGEILGLAGESGCGKTSTAFTVLLLNTPTSGRVLFEGEDLHSFQGEALKTFRRKVQIIFQDPYQSLNPRFRVANSVAEPLVIHGMKDPEERMERTLGALRSAGLCPPEDYLERYPHELSGGQRQRIAIARGIVLNPSLLVADEPSSMLDVSVRAGILNLLKHYAKDDGVAILYISHDLGTIRYICDRTAVMYLGRIVELGDTEKVITNPQHPYTRALIDSVPEINPAVKRPTADLLGRFIEEERPPLGCRFYPRCTKHIDRCTQEEPELTLVSEGHEAACFRTG